MNGDDKGMFRCATNAAAVNASSTEGIHQAPPLMKEEDKQVANGTLPAAHAESVQVKGICGWAMNWCLQEIDDGLKRVPSLPG